MTTEAYKNFMEYKFANALWTYMSPSLIAIGLACNTLVIVVLTKTSITNTTTSLYLRVLAVFDSLVLCVFLARLWIKESLGYDIWLYSSAVCKIHTWAAYLVTYTSAWLLVSVTLERCFCVWFPHKVKVVCTIRKTYIIIVSIILFMAILNVHFFYGFGDNEQPSGNGIMVDPCSPLNGDYNNFGLLIWSWLDLCVYSVFPSIIIILCNTSIIYKVVSKSRRSLRNDSANINNIQNRSASSRRSEASSLTTMLIVTSITYVVCTAPFCNFVIYSTTVTMDNFDNAHDKAADELIWVLIYTIQFINNCINFILYCVSGKRFRDELKSLCGRREQRRSDIYNIPASNTRSSAVNTSVNSLQ